MPIITRIAAQKRRRGRYSLYCDDKYALALSENDLVANGLHTGQELSSEQLEALIKTSSESKLLERVYNYLSYRQRTEAEIRGYLKRHDCAPEQAESILERLRQQNLVADEQFAKNWIGARQTLRPRSRRHLEQELKQKGLDSDLVSQALADVSDEDEVEAIKTIAKKKLVQVKYQDQPKLISYLLNQGFEYRLVKTALESLTEAT